MGSRKGVRWGKKLKNCCFFIDNHICSGSYDEEDKISCILFKDLFELYASISSNVGVPAPNFEFSKLLLVGCWRFATRA